ncbi:helicase-related protein, partial [Hafnia sp.]
MIIKSIKKQIAELGEQRIKEIQDKYTFGGITPYEYQCVMFDEIGKRIGRYKHPFIVKASVSAGKTIGFAMIASRVSEMGLSMAILARQGDIVKQDSDELRNFGVDNSVYCAGLGTKSAYFPILVGSEGTVANGLFKALGDFTPMVLGIDECHQVDDQDLADAIDKEESIEQMSRASDEPYMINGVVCDRGTKMPDERSNIVVRGTGRSQYTIIIVELQRRCKEKYGKELRIFGMTGSEFRGTTPIVVANYERKGFWREQVTNIDTSYLIEFGSVVPTVFGGTSGVHYDLDKFKASGEDGTKDFSDKELKQMEDEINRDSEKTKLIMRMVVEEAKKRNGVLITCAGQRHCKEAASHLPEGSTYAIITEKTNTKKRGAILEAANRGEIKYIFQVMALTTGVNVPFWDFSVILRKIGSLTLLIQLLGRGMRLLKQWQIEAGIVKSDHLVWDFAGTMDELGQLYFDPVLEEAQYQQRSGGVKAPKTCEICHTENSFFARRCMGKDSAGNRCEYFWKSRICEDQIDERTKKVIHKGCGAENDIVARVCRKCDVSLKDPDDNLNGKAYTKNDWFDVVDFKVELTNNGKGI